MARSVRPIGGADRPGSRTPPQTRNLALNIRMAARSTPSPCRTRWYMKPNSIAASPASGRCESAWHPLRVMHNAVDRDGIDDRGITQRSSHDASPTAPGRDSSTWPVHVAEWQRGNASMASAGIGQHCPGTFPRWDSRNP
jgi:hypothetical protein